VAQKNNAPIQINDLTTQLSNSGDLDDLSSVNRFFMRPSYHGRTLHESGGVLEDHFKSHYLIALRLRLMSIPFSLSRCGKYAWE
jgi:hypothetical protein